MTFRTQLKPANYTVSSLIVSIGGFLNGYDTGIIGAVVTMPQWNSIMGDISPTLIGVTVSMIMIGGVIPSFFSGQLSDKYGRLAMMGLGGSTFTIGCILQAASFQLGQFSKSCLLKEDVQMLLNFWAVAGRLVAGIGEGIYLGTLNVYERDDESSRNSVTDQPTATSAR